MKQVYCPYCGHLADFVDSAEVYHGRSYGMIYLCRRCDAYVGCHGNGDVPKGSLANAELREWRKKAHARFDPLWQYGQFRHRRNAAYAWLARKMQIPVEQAHIGMFDVGQCKKLIAILNNERSYPNVQE